MKSNPRNIIAAAATLVWVGSALAGDKNPPYIPPAIVPPPTQDGGVYVSLFGGVNFDAGHSSQYTSDCGCVFDLDWDKDTGGYGGLEIGYATAWSTGFAMLFEVEGFYNGYDVNASASDYGWQVASGTAKVKTLNFMVNAIARYDFGRFGIFAGGGVGYYDADIDHLDFDLYGNRYNTSRDFDIDSGFAWQLTAGVDFEVTENVDLYTEYRYLVYETDLDLGGFNEQHLLGGGVRYHW